jgi:hypothetical protein
LNTTDPYLLSDEDLKSMSIRKIKNQEFSRLMNKYFKTVKHTWYHNGVKFKKLENFETINGNLIGNYDWKSLPKHNCGVYGHCLLVYHWGKLYYFTVSYNGYKQGQLLDIKTKSHVQWAQAKNCSPVKNCQDKKII